MQIQSKLIAMLLLSSTVLFGCGGGDPPITERSDTGGGGGGGNGGGGDGGGGGGSTAQGISYLPLMIYEAYTEYSGMPADGIFLFEQQAPLVPAFLINPVDSSTLQSVSTATAGDYRVTIDGVDIDDSESFPTLQRVIGSSTQLRTALVFDISNSVHGVDMQALVDAAKAYVASAQAHSNPAISGQQFVVWAFAQNIQELTSGFTSSPVTINAALDGVITLRNSNGLAFSSNLHRAVVQVVGRYNEDGFDFSADGDNDLEDTAGSAGIVLTQLVMFSSGPDTYLEFDQASMSRAISSQSFLKYDVSAAASVNATEFLKKPVFYYVVGGTSAGNTYAALSNEAEATRSLTLTGGAYDFTSSLIASQISAIDTRVDLDNQYLFRFGLIPRVGDHTVVFFSNATGNNYSLTTSYDEAEIIGRPALAPWVEITGPDGEYLANNAASFAEVQTFVPVTRWTHSAYSATDYDWDVTSGALSGAENPDGSYTVTAVTSSPAVLRLRNNQLALPSGERTIVITND